MTARQHNMFEIAAIIFSQLFGKRERNTRPGLHLAIVCHILYNPGNAIVVTVIFIERNFIPDPQTDQQRYRHTDGKTRYIDK